MLRPQVVRTYLVFWLWQFQSPNNRVVCISDKVFKTKGAAVASLNKFIDNMEAECRGGCLMNRRKIEVVE